VVAALEEGEGFVAGGCIADWGRWVGLFLIWENFVSEIILFLFLN
jgi:hypothetical protein